MDIYKGLTFRKGAHEVNVHSCKDGVVYYGHYRDSDDWPTDLHQATLGVFSDLAEKAVEHGATAFSLLTANDRGNRPPREAASQRDDGCRRSG